MLDTCFPPELLPPAQMGEADRRAAMLGRPGTALMEAAGWAVARAARRFGPCRTLVLCGPGNNGGDGWVAARLLAEQGWPVTVASLVPPREGTDAAAMAARWRGPVAAFGPESAARADLVIDAVFGAGLSRDLDSQVVETLRAARRVLAVDVPSGLDGASGQPCGFAPQAALTVTFFRLKPGHVLLPGRALCGQIVLADIGIPDRVLQDIRPECFLNGSSLWSLPRIAEEGHKYSRGHVTILGGPVMTGAARLAAAAARRAGAGLVTIAAEEGGDLYRSGGEPGLIVSDGPVDELLRDPRRKVWICGPGLGAERAGALLPRLLGTGRQVVADADVFTAFAGRPEMLRGCAVLTPHAGEFARVFGDPGADRVASVQAVARLAQGVVVLKGPDTIIAAPDGRVAINASAPPDLATAGSGDVLSGIIAALLASGMPSWEAACAGVWVHGRAGVIAGPGLVAEDLPQAIARAMQER